MDLIIIPLYSNFSFKALYARPWTLKTMTIPG